MKYFIIAIISTFIFYGCSGSLIRINVAPDQNVYPMFGKIPERDFFFSQDIGDTLIKKWENSVNGGFTNTSITAYGNYIFVGDLSGRIYCFNNSTGKQAGKLKNRGAIYSSPVIDDLNIFFAVAAENSNESDLISYNFFKGEENFDKEIKGRVLDEIIKKDDALIFNTEDGRLYKFNLSGEEEWKLETKSFTHSSPALFNNIVFFGNDKGEIMAVSSKSGKLIYRKKVGEPFFGGAIISDSIAYIGNDNGKLYAVGIESGNIKWEFDTHARITMIPALKDDVIIIGNLNGDLYAIEKSVGSLIWKLSTNGILDSTPLITNDFIVVPDLNKKFYMIDFQTGEIIKTYNLEGMVKLSPVIADSTLFIGYENGNICAYEF